MVVFSLEMESARLQNVGLNMVRDRTRWLKSLCLKRLNHHWVTCDSQHRTVSFLLSTLTCKWRDACALLPPATKQWRTILRVQPCKTSWIRPPPLWDSYLTHQTQVTKASVCCCWCQHWQTGFTAEERHGVGLPVPLHLFFFLSFTWATNDDGWI